MTVYIDTRFLKHTLDLEKNAILKKADLVDEQSEVHLTQKNNYLKIEKNCAEIKNTIDNLPCIIVDSEKIYSNNLSDLDKIDTKDIKWYSYIKKLIKKESNDVIFRDQKIFDDYNAVYFLDKSDKAVLNLKKSGVLCTDSSFSGLSLFEKYTIHEDPFQFNNLNNFQDRFPATNAMIIYDQYIFGRPYVEKLENLIAFIKSHKCERLEIPFHLTIFYSRYKKDEIFGERHFNLIKNELKKIKNLCFELVELNSRISRDRYMITNYCYMKSGHPFCDTPTPSDFTQILDLYNDNLRSKKIKDYHNLLEKTPKNLIFKSNPDFQNRIFDGIA